MDIKEELRNLKQQISHWNEVFYAENGREAKGIDVEQCANLQKLRNRLQKLEQLNAPPPISGGCEFYIKRRRRYCTQMATSGSKYCSSHREGSAIVAENRVCKTAGKKQNLKRTLKRMLNPFIVRPLKDSPNWSEIFRDLTKATWLDIGCARGLYIKSHRDKVGGFNYIGVEIFGKLVEVANAAELEVNLGNLFYISANINASFDILNLKNLQRVTLMFPDPWSCGNNESKKNKKRRVMTPKFAEQIASAMQCCGEFYFASDWHELATEIRSCLLDSGYFTVPCGTPSGSNGVTCNPPYVPTLTATEINERGSRKSNALIDVKKKFEKTFKEDGALWLDGIPFEGVQTERDLVCEVQWRVVYRLVVIRNDNIVI